MEESTCEPRVKRQKIDKTGRFAALAKLKELKGSKNKYEVDSEVENVYEVVDEKEYAKKARELYGGDWIEDDGTGYAEDGRDFFEDDDYVNEETFKDSAPKGSAKKRSRLADKNEKSKGTLRNMFLNSTKKKSVPSIKDDYVLADILGQLDSECGQMGPSTSNQIRREMPQINGSTIIKNHSVKNTDTAVAKEYMNNFMNYKKPALTENISKVSDEGNDVEKSLDNAPSACTKLVEDENSEQGLEEISLNYDKTILDSDDFNVGDLDIDENQFDIESLTTSNSGKKSENCSNKVHSENEENMDKLLHNWKNICQADNVDENSTTTSTSTFKVPMVPSSGEHFNFWYWEAWEDATRRLGEIFLFGRTSDGKSVCVRIENVDRVLYLLPREYLLDSISLEPTKQKVTLADLYKEFDNTIATDLNLSEFRSKKVTKYFGNHPVGIEVPQECDYMEIHYNGKKPPPKPKAKYTSIAHIFGANTTALERFLLDRKIKGPCWLQLQQFKTTVAPFSWCKMNVSVSDARYVLRVDNNKAPPPPSLALLTLNVRTTLNPKTLKNEICMIAMLVHDRYHIDKAPPQPPFNRHLCALTRPVSCPWPLDFNSKMSTYKATKIYKHDTERSLLSWFIAQYQQIDADLVVTHDAMDCQLDVIADRIITLKISQWSRLGRLRMSVPSGKKMLDFYIGRMICDVKRSAEECMRSRSYDLQTLCTNVLLIKESDRLNVIEEDIFEMFEKSDSILKLITLTMQDASYILRLMYDLNIMPLALQITNICGNIMTGTLQSGRSERNEYLLLHAFTEKNYIVPDKKTRDYSRHTQPPEDDDQNASSTTLTGSIPARKKAAYSGGLVLEPIIGLYDKYILLLDFNSLYPSIIQEYNICFTTVQTPSIGDELPQLPDQNAEIGILPQQLRRLVESRREVKKLMAASDLSPDLKMQYHIRQMALKLTANSMYGCLGFAHSRFFAQHLAALITHKGREILNNTQAIVHKMNYTVVYGDTDSIMVNTNIKDYDQVIKIGTLIKQSVNKLYKQLELDIDGIFSCLLLLKKKKYAAVKIVKTYKGELLKEQEHKGLDIVRRDWSQISIMVGRAVLDEILSDKMLDDKLEEVHSHLERVREQIQNGQVPLPMFVITKQLSRPPGEFNKNAAQPHVQVALRMNATRNRRYKKGDMVDYVICDDGTKNPATQRAYHLDEIRSNENLKIENNYYLAHQIHPVVTRMLEVLEGTDASRIAECLGLDGNKYKSRTQLTNNENPDTNISGESITKCTMNTYRACDKFRFTCIQCKKENSMDSPLRLNDTGTQEAALLRCPNNECTTAPYKNIVVIRNQLLLQMRSFVKRFYQNWLVCDDPACNLNTRSYTHITSQRKLVCMRCNNGFLIRQYTAHDLNIQLSFFQHIFDLTKVDNKNPKLKYEQELIAAYQLLKETVEHQREKSAYAEISLAKLFQRIKLYTTKTTPAPTFKQRQLELHRLRVLVEQKRLQLLEIKLQREQDEMAHERQLFEKDLEAKRAAFFKSLGSENDA